MTTQDPKYKHKPSEKHTLEEVLKSLQDLIRNDLLDNSQAAVEKSGSAPVPGEEKPTREFTVPAREDFAPVNPAAGPVNLDAVMRSLKDLVSNELNVGGESAAAEESPPARTENHAASENLADELVPLDEDLGMAEESSSSLTEDHDAPEKLTDAFEPLDEELTFEESMEIVPPPVTAPTIPEIPGEISTEMLSEPEVEAASPPSPPAPAPAPTPEVETNIAPGTQQQLLFEEAPLIGTEPAPSALDLAPKLELVAETTTDDDAPELTQETVAPDSPEISGDALPTIDVEETFDENAYFEAAAKQTESASTDTQETQEIVLSAPGESPEPETAPPANGEAQAPAEHPTPAAESDSGKPELKLEIVNEPIAENLQNIPSVDFDVIEFEPPREEPSPPSLTIETPAPVDESSPITTDDSLVQEITLDPGPLETLLPSEETKPGSTPETGKVPDTATTPPATGETQASAPATEPAAPETTESIDLDDIPVLHEVVAPPAGSALAGEPASPASTPPLPAPDRARDIVVRAVAKLNVEMRKSGGAGLDTKTILRLQQLIRRELEKDGEKS